MTVSPSPLGPQTGFDGGEHLGVVELEALDVRAVEKGHPDRVHVSLFSLMR
jgi:hypothetical protein